MKRIFILLLALLLSLSGLAQPDTLLHTFAEARVIKDKLTVKRLSLADVVTNQKSIPKEIRGFKNLEYLSLRPRATRFIRPISGGPCIIGYPKTKTTTLPSWINELNALEELDLIGINNINYSEEIAKLVHLNKLRKLSIDPDNFDDQLLRVLIQLNELKSLKIRATPTDEQIDTLKRELPNCEIVTGLYADY
jgi:Leucine-rich repeat (LRR) protein